MKIKFKTFTLIFLFIILALFYILGSKSIKNSNLNVFFKIKSFIPSSVKHYLKNTIFIIPTLKKRINELDKIIVFQKKSLHTKEEIIKEIPDKFLEGSYPLISFKRTEENEIIKTKYSKYLLTKFETGYLFNGKAADATASAYIEEYNDKILIVTGDGIFSYFYKQNLNQNSFDLITIPTNIKEIVKYSYFYKHSRYGI